MVTIARRSAILTKNITVTAATIRINIAVSIHHATGTGITISQGDKTSTSIAYTHTWQTCFVNYRWKPRNEFCHFNYFSIINKNDKEEFKKLCVLIEWIILFSCSPLVLLISFYNWFFFVLQKIRHWISFALISLLISCSFLLSFKARR